MKNFTLQMFRFADEWSLKFSNFIRRRFIRDDHNNNEQTQRDPEPRETDQREKSKIQKGGKKEEMGRERVTASASGKGHMNEKCYFPGLQQIDEDTTYLDNAEELLIFEVLTHRYPLKREPLNALMETNEYLKREEGEEEEEESETTESSGSSSDTEKAKPVWKKKDKFEIDLPYRCTDAEGRSVVLKRRTLFGIEREVVNLWAVRKYHGETLKDILAGGVKIERANIYNILYQVAAILKELNQMKLSYNNLQSGNICIDIDEDNLPVVTLINFQNMCKIGQTAGFKVTPKDVAMAPEIHKQQFVKENSDVYSLTVLLKELTKKSPLNYTKLFRLKQLGCNYFSKERLDMDTCENVLKYALERAQKLQVGKDQLLKDVLKISTSEYSRLQNAFRIRVDVRRLIPDTVPLISRQQISECVEDMAFTKIRRGKYTVAYLADYYGTMAVSTLISDKDHFIDAIYGLELIQQKKKQLRGLEELIAVSPKTSEILTLDHGPTLKEWYDDDKLKPVNYMHIISMILVSVKEFISLGHCHNQINERNFCVNENLEVTLINFGWTRVTGQDLFKRWIIDPKHEELDYLAPEILKGGPTSVKAEIYSVGKLVRKLTLRLNTTFRKLENWLERAANSHPDDRPALKEGLDIALECLTHYMEDEDVANLPPGTKKRDIRRQRKL
ncbi:hypothetical protein SK128_006294 [Halocaridina rubra]|uniref:Protein kinase domain-containing protein n=1 Tax=Halocaridina rubra TaxID=373956 RepID=A0AAN8XSI9_HALRR